MEKIRNELLEQFQKEVSDFKGVSNKRLKEFSKLISDFFEAMPISFYCFDFEGYGVRKVKAKNGSEVFFIKLAGSKALPHKSELCGKGLYLYDDINAYVKFMNCEESLAAIKIIPKFLNNAAAVVQQFEEEFRRAELKITKEVR